MKQHECCLIMLHMYSKCVMCVVQIYCIHSYKYSKEFGDDHCVECTSIASFGQCRSKVITQTNVYAVSFGASLWVYVWMCIIKAARGRKNATKHNKGCHFISCLEADTWFLRIV